MPDSLEAVAIDSLFLTLRDSLPRLVASANDFRKASVHLPLGPYLGRGTLKVNGASVQLAAGPLEASEIAALINANVPSVLAHSEVDGSNSRLVISSRSKPTLGAASIVSVSGVLGSHESTNTFLESPKLYATELGKQVRIESPVVFLSDAPTVARERSLRAGLYVVSVPLEIIYPGSVNRSPEIARESAREIQYCIQKAIELGDSRGPYFVGGSVVGASVIQATLPRLTVSPKSYEYVSGTTSIPVGVCSLEIQIRISRNEV